MWTIPTQEEANAFSEAYLSSQAEYFALKENEKMTINDLVEKAHRTAVEHGFWENPPEFGTAIALIHSELSEALEEVRGGKESVYYVDGKPEGYAIELADAVIRIADLCGHFGIDLDEAIRIKMKYNETRPYKHGKKF